MMVDLERDGLDILTAMGLTCFGRLGHVPVRAIVPDAMVSSDENLEFDYFVLHQGICIVCELSGLSDESDLREKYRRFCHNVTLFAAEDSSRKFGPFSIPEQSRHLFREVRSVEALFITAKCDRFDVALAPVTGVAVAYRSDWQTLSSYVNAFGRYAQGPFFRLVGISDVCDMETDLRFEAAGNNLLRLPNRFIAGDLEIRADVFTMVTSPARLLEVAEIYRRELMPIVAVDSRDRYQRPLDFAKLEKMQRLVVREDFMFPNSILVALDKKCQYDDSQQQLRVPMIYGAMSVIDGQHRLYAYALREVPDRVRTDARILVTALRFVTETNEEMLRSSARVCRDQQDTEANLDGPYR